MSGLTLRLMEERLAIVRLPHDAPLPQWLDLSARFVSVTRTGDELSIVCRSDVVPAALPEGALVQGPFRCFVALGPLAFDVVGVLAKLSGALAGAGISLFTISTYDTDYVLVAEEKVRQAAEALAAVAEVVERA